MKKHLQAIAAVILLILVQQFVTIPFVFADSVTITSTPLFYVNSNQLYSYKIIAKSDSNRPLTFSFPLVPNWLSFDKNTSILSGTPVNPGKYTINITASDGYGKESQNYWLYVQSTQVSTTPVSETPTPTPTSPAPTPSPTMIVTSTPTSTATPSPTKAVVTITIKSTTITTTPSDSGSGTTPNNVQTLNNLNPGKESVIKDSSPLISGSIHTGFALDRKNLNMFFDNNDITNNIDLTTQKNSDGNYDNIFKYQSHNLSNSLHKVSMTITNPDGLIIPTSWAFTVNNASSPASQVANAAKKISSGLIIGIVVALLALLIFIIILVRLIRQKPEIKTVEEKP